jgi:hypothetical protein
LYSSVLLEHTACLFAYSSASASSTTRNCLERIVTLTYIAAERTWTYSKQISRDRYPASLLARRSDLEKTASSIVACSIVFTELLPGNALIKSVTILWVRFHIWIKCSRHILILRVICYKFIINYTHRVHRCLFTNEFDAERHKLKRMLHHYFHTTQFCFR